MMIKSVNTALGRSQQSNVGQITTILFILIVLTLITTSITTVMGQSSMIDGVAIENANGSSTATRLIDGSTGASNSRAWNPGWYGSSAYPMEVVVDFGDTYEIDTIHYHMGNYHAGHAQLHMFVSESASGPFTSVGSSSVETWDDWVDHSIGNVIGRYVKLQFNGNLEKFNISELKISGSSIIVDPPCLTINNTVVDVAGVTAADYANGTGTSGRLVDGDTGVGNSVAYNPGWYSSSNFPMSAYVDFGDTYEIVGIRYFMGNYHAGNAKAHFYIAESNPQSAGSWSYVGAATAEVWNDWTTHSIPPTNGRYVRVQFEANLEKFNISELGIIGSVDDCDDDPDDPDDPDEPDPNDPIVTGQEHAAANANISLSHGFGAWSTKPGVVGTLSDACIDLHDSHWVVVGGKVYHTWHDVYEEHPTSTVNGQPEMCVYGHDHGDDPRTSPLFDYAFDGKMPAFGFAMETFNHGGGHMPGEPHRHEDHVGHKVTVATYRASIGNPPNGNLAVYDAGFYCHFLSKIHQGSYSNDALSNQTHEYFINVRCDDNPNGLAQRIQSGASADSRLSDDNNIRTQFSFKLMVPFGEGDQFREMCNQSVVTTHINGNPQITALPGMFDASRTPGLTTSNTPNPREIGCFEQWAREYRFGIPDTISQQDLWTQPNQVTDHTGASATFQVYYAIKDASRMYDKVSNSVKYTVDHCQTINAFFNNQPGTHRFCDLVGNQEWDDPDSPFKGALRAIHFKKFALYNNSASRNEAFCTNALGLDASPVLASGECPSGKILQKIKAFNGGNGWDNFTNPVTGVEGTVSGSLYVLGQDLLYPNQPNDQANYQLVSGSYPLPGQSGATGLFRPNQSGRTGTDCPRNNEIEYYIEGTDQQDGQGNFIASLVSTSTINNRADHAYCPVGIGFEKIVDKRDVPSSVCSQVAPGRNCSVHAPN